MKALNLKITVGCAACLILLLLIAGCQSAPKEEVVAEGEMDCVFTPVNEMLVGVEREEPDLGQITRGYLVSVDMDCPEPYSKGRVVALFEMGDNLLLGYHEVYTDEGGVWKGVCDNNGPSSKCSFEGDGKYKGLKYTSEMSFSTNKMKYRVTKAAEE
jgi:hypothetical protein